MPRSQRSSAATAASDLTSPDVMALGRRSERTPRHACAVPWLPLRRTVNDRRPVGVRGRRHCGGGGALRSLRAPAQRDLHPGSTRVKACSRASEGTGGGPAAAWAPCPALGIWPEADIPAELYESPAK